jgi:hypothetical protein
VSEDVVETADVRVLRWPWALGEDAAAVRLADGRGTLPFDGTAILACPRGMRIAAGSGAAELEPLVRTRSSDLYELPHGRAGAVETALEIQGSAGFEHARWSLGLEGARTRFEKPREGGDGQQESAESIAVLDWWEAFNDLLVAGEAPDGAIPWERAESWLDRLSESGEPRRALIVEIAERIGPTIVDRARRLRRVHLRRREMVPIHRVQRLDEASLRWYIRRPGRTLEEKLGHRQEIMSVAGHETFDTLENRVLKDFLQRCIRAANRYGRRFQNDSRRSERVLLVQRFARACEEALRVPELESVQRLPRDVRPNHVLQSDPRYREIWHGYQKLIRNDVCRLLLGAAASQLTRSARDRSSGISELTRAPFYVELESRRGGRLARGWEPGPFVIRRSGAIDGVLTLVDSSQLEEHPVGSHLAETGGHSYLVREPLDASRGPLDVVVVWAINGLSTCQEIDPEAMASSAKRALKRLGSDLVADDFTVHRLTGLILVSGLGAENGNLSGASSSKRSEPRVGVLRIGSDPRSWAEAAREIASRLEQRI